MRISDWSSDVCSSYLTSAYIDALGPAEAPAKGPGLYYMDTSSAAAECVTLMAAAGYVIHTFPTGQGNVVGNPIVPVIKISAKDRKRAGEGKSGAARVDLGGCRNIQKNKEAIKK